MRSFLVSNSFEPLIQEAWKWVAGLNSHQVLILAPTPGCADDFVRSPRAIESRVSSFGRRTVLRLASEIAIPEMADREVLPVTGLAVEALCARAVSDALKSGRLSYFHAVADTPGMSRALARTLLELRLQETCLEGLQALGAVGRDLSRLGLRFESYLRDDGLADSSLTYQLAVESLEKQATLLAETPILFYHVRPLRSLEARFVSLLSERAPETLAVALDSDREAIELFSGILNTAPRRLARRAADCRLERLRRYLFSPAVPPRSETGAEASFNFFSAPGESRESVEIARRIRRAADNGVRFDQMAVALRNPESYMPLLQDAFRRAGIPAYFTRGTRRPDPGGRAFLALLECAAEGLSATRFAEYLSLAQVPPQSEDQEKPRQVEWVEPKDEQLCFKTLLSPGAEEPALGLEPFSMDSRDAAGSLRAPERWERLLVDAAVIGGRDRWKRRLQGLESELRLQIKEVASESARTTQHLEEKLFLLQNLKSFCLPLIGLLDRLPTEASWSRWLTRLEEISVRALKHPDTVLSVLAELKPMGEVEAVRLDEVRRVLRERLTLLREDPPPNRYGQVTVASIDELRGRCFDLVFLPAMAEGIFPRKALEDPLLLDRHRRALGIASVLARRRADERLLLRVAVAAAVRSLVVSYPRIDVAQGRSRVPSFYALDILRAVDGVLPDLRGLEKQGAETSSSRLGWPAPREPAVAIDDTEFDLALLHPMLQLGPSGRRGRAQFLLKSNSHLARALRARAGRWRRRFYAADGLVDAGSRAVEILQGQRLRERSYSPTSLQQYAVCPYKFFLYAIHRLRVREEPVALQQLDPLTRGSLFHEVQFRFLSQLREAGQLPVTRQSEAAAMDSLDSVFGDVAGSTRERLAPAIPRIWESEMEELLTDLRGWLREMSRADEAWIPAHFELAFGLAADPDRDPASTIREVRILSGIRLRGSIDLVEVLRSDGRTAVRVTDHKTGRPFRLAGGQRLEVGGGEILQPIVYGLAAEQLLDEEVEYGQLFYCTRRGGYQRRIVSIHSGTCAKLKQVLETIDRNMEQGFLPAAPRQDACKFCDFQAVCGPYEQIRIRRKEQSRLADLSELRKLP